MVPTISIHKIEQAWLRRVKKPLVDTKEKLGKGGWRIFSNYRLKIFSNEKLGKRSYKNSQEFIYAK